ncbi:helix-turn-helix domain-containing protein [Allosphingosinicella sp.]|jgi:transcriptional regulator with XRE-family HTH domain|uniref:helix-turn-helix domain-containing protein n=1 Tax=Allosphingosinicella sp. TaxID=2823234 RepID=UPI002F10C3B2
MESGAGSGSDEVAERIREELGRRRLTRQWLADEARISLSTLEKALAGQRRFTTGTLVRIEVALGLSLRPRLVSGNRGAGVAPDELGAYARPAVRWLEGDYLTVRPAFSVPGALFTYLTTMSWDEERSHLVFRETERLDSDYAQRGDLALPHQSGHIYLVTREAGQFRLAVLGRPTIAGALYGLLTTLQAAGGSRLLPVSCPIALLPVAQGWTPRFGTFRPGDPGYDDLSAPLARVETEGFARLVGGPERASA